MNFSLAFKEWQALLGGSQVLDGEAASRTYGNDTSGSKKLVAAALLIQDSATLQDVMRIATKCLVPVYPISTGQNWGYGSALPATDGCVIVDLSRLTKIDFEAEFGIVTVEPGVTQGMLADFLDADDHPFLVPVTGAGPTCSLLGNALERGYGVTPYVDHFGAVTDVEAVLPDGSLYRSALREAGGVELARLFKWGLGPYSNGLFTQSGFGIVTRLSIILARRPECIKVCLFSLKDDALLEQTVVHIRSITGRLAGTVGAFNLMNQRRVLSMTAPFPFDQLNPDGLVSEAVINRLGQHHHVLPWTGFGTLYGTRHMVAAAQREITQTLKDTVTRLWFVTPQRARQFASLAKWIPGKIGRGLQGMTSTLSNSLELVAGRPNETALPLAYWRTGRLQMDSLKNPARDGCGLTWYAPLVPMRPTDVRAYVNMIKEVLPRHGMEPLITFTTLSDRLFDSTVPLLFDRDEPDALAAASACYAELLYAGKKQGWFPYRVGIEAMPALAKLMSNSGLFHERLRKDLDPHDILSPGRYR